MFDVAWAVCRAGGLVVGIGKDAEGKPKGNKTAWSGGEWRRSGGGEWEWRECGGDRAMRLPDGRVVPYVPLYKHLGSPLAAQLQHDGVRGRLVKRCRSLLGALGRLGVLDARQFERASRSVVDSLIGYYGRSTPMDWETCERIERMRRGVLRALGHLPRGAASAMAYAPHAPFEAWHQLAV